MHSTVQHSVGNNERLVRNIVSNCYIAIYRFYLHVHVFRLDHVFVCHSLQRRHINMNFVTPIMNLFVM